MGQSVLTYEKQKVVLPTTVLQNSFNTSLEPLPPGWRKRQPKTYVPPRGNQP